MAEEEPAIVFFDGVCGLCDRLVNFVLARDKRGRFVFAPIQGPTAAAEFGRMPETVVFKEGGRIYGGSDAILRILAGLGWRWAWVRVFFAVPKSLREVVYGWISRHRYHWFGKREACRLPSPAERTRFLD